VVPPPRPSRSVVVDTCETFCRSIPPWVNCISDHLPFLSRLVIAIYFLARPRSFLYLSIFVFFFFFSFFWLWCFQGTSSAVGRSIGRLASFSPSNFFWTKILTKPFLSQSTVRLVQTPAWLADLFPPLLFLFPLTEPVIF